LDSETRIGDIDEIYKKLNKIYTRGDIFKDFILKTSIFPLELKLKKVSQKDIQNYYPTFTKELDRLKKSELSLQFKEYNYKTLGVQKLPFLIRVERLDDFLKLIGKKEEYQNFINLYTKIVLKYPTLEKLFLKKPFLVLEYQEHWDRFILIIDFFLQKREKAVYIRQISLDKIDTKYIEKHKKVLDIFLSNILQIEPLSSISEFAFEKRYNCLYPLPQVRFRILDSELFISGLSDLTLCIDEFKKLKIECKKVFIVENKITTLAFPNIKDSIVIFGSGYKVGILKDVEWLKDKEIIYWGDIDADGFAILSQIRGYFPHVKSMLMDRQTFDKFKDFAVKCPFSAVKELKHLTKSEQEIYTLLDGWRLEQEKIPLGYIKEKDE
jgi:hypothetical protein